jgi:hypothetical protein
MELFLFLFANGKKLKLIDLNPTKHMLNAQVVGDGYCCLINFSYVLSFLLAKLFQKNLEHFLEF